MAKITQVNNGDTGLEARNKINEAMKTVEVDATLSGDGTTGNPLKVENTTPGGGLTIPTQTPVSIGQASIQNIVLNNQALPWSFIDGVTAFTITVSAGSNTEVKEARRFLDNSANNSAVIITLSDANMTINEDDGNNLVLAANSKYTLDVNNLSATEVDILSIIPKK